MKNAPSINITGRYNFADKPLFEVENLQIKAAQWTCLLGASGVGKSTLLRLILNLEMDGHFDGKITIDDGLPLTNRVSYMAQSDLLLPWLNVVDNICLGANLRGDIYDQDIVHSLVNQLGLSAHKGKFPQALSGGMRQRVALGRTLMEDRPIVLLDEPFSALDAYNRAEMQELAFKFLRHKTVLLVTHDPAEAARLAEQIILLSSDKMMVWDSPSTPAIRAINAPETLACQHNLFEFLRDFKNGAPYEKA